MSSLARNLTLSIERVPEQEGREQLKISLRDDLAMTELCVCQLIGNNTSNKHYHVREALVIAMRRLVAAALDQGMIKIGSLSRGVSVTLKDGWAPSWCAK